MSDTVQVDLDSDIFSYNGLSDEVSPSESLLQESYSLNQVFSPFTVIVDSYEQQPYQFLSIVGDYRDDYAPIKVSTVRKRLSTGDYAILGVPGICIERKSKADLFQSLHDSDKRENFLGRLQRIQEEHEWGAVMIECYPSEVLNNPPFYTSLNPKTIIRTTFSWAQQFPLCHWYWAADRDMAEQMTYRILEKFYQHKTDKKYKPHYKMVDDNVEAFRQGMLTRMNSVENWIPYCKDNPLRVSWMKGYQFAVSHFYNGDSGELHEPGEIIKTSKNEKARVKESENKHIPLPGQSSFLEDLEPGHTSAVWIKDQFDQTTKKSKKKKIQ